MIIYPNRAWIALRMIGFAVVFGGSSIWSIWWGVRRLADGSSALLCVGWLAVSAMILLMTVALVYSEFQVLADHRPLLAADRAGIWVRPPYGGARRTMSTRYLPWSAVDAVYLLSYRASADGGPSTFLCIRPKGEPGEAATQPRHSRRVRFYVEQFGTPYAFDMSDVRATATGVRVELDRLLPAGMRVEDRPENDLAG